MLPSTTWAGVGFPDVEQLHHLHHSSKVAEVMAAAVEHYFDNVDCSCTVVFGVVDRNKLD